MRSMRACNAHQEGCPCLVLLVQCAKGQSCVRCQIEYEYLCSACTRRLGELECTACGGWAQGATSLLGFEFDKKCRLVRGPEPGR